MMNQPRTEAPGTRAALYARVSSEGQAEKDLSIPAQLKALRDYATKRGWTVHAEYVDEAKSARSADRPKFQEMIATARQKEAPFNAILVWKLSRFARNREDSIIYKKLLRKHGVEVVSINEQIDDSPSGRLLEGIIEVIDEFYSANLASDTIRGMKENARRGFLNGSVAPFGYRIAKVMVDGNQKAKLAVAKEEAPLVKRIFKLCLDGRGAKEIARALNDEGVRTRRGGRWEVNGVRYIMRNETYTGVLVFNRVRKHPLREGQNWGEHTVRVEDAHPAIIDKETFERAQAVITARSPRRVHPRTVSSNYLLSGFLFCACGANMVGQAAKSSRFFYYGCHNRQRRGEHGCESRLVSRERIEAAVSRLLKERVLTEENLTRLIASVNAKVNGERAEIGRLLEAKDAQVAALNAKLDSLYGALETGKVDLDDLAPRIKALRGQIDEAKRGRIDLEIKLALEPVRVSPTEVRRHVKDLQGLLEEGAFFERKSFLRSWIKRIVMDRPNGGTVEYQLPLGPAKTDGRPREEDGRSSRTEVLSIGQIGVTEGT
ncbi:MAG: recombinase family protein [Elusimicrobiota bacterium]|nr:recombinase family protein [Elusimicrobiota bacterium]